MLKYPDVMLARLPEGIFARMDAVRGSSQRADLIRMAIERELERRENPHTATMKAELDKPGHGAFTAPTPHKPAPKAVSRLDKSSIGKRLSKKGA